MGDPRRKRKKYSTPTHPWQGERIDEEKTLMTEYGLKNKKEIWKADSLLRNFKSQAKRLISLPTKQAEIEATQLLKKMNSLGLLEKNAKVEDVLGVNLRDVLERRFQTLVFRKKFSRSITQARQFITHRHMAIADRAIDVPSYLVKTEEESKLHVRPTSSLFSEDHPERIIEEKKKPVKKKAEKKTKVKERKNEK